MKKSTSISILWIFFLWQVPTTSAQISQYCASKGSFPWEQWIERVSISSNNFGNHSGKDGYGDFTNLTGATLQRNTGNLITISPQSSWNGDPRNAHMFWRVWVDFNGDHDFNDAGETVISRQVVIQSHIFLDNEAAFTPPASARLGKTRLRVAMKVGGYPDPCETFERGEVEDYTLNIVEPSVGMDTLRLVGITGARAVRQGEDITLNISIKNTGTAPSQPSTPLSIYQNQQPFIFKGPPPTFLTLVSDKKAICQVIQPNEVVTIPMTFRLYPNFSHLSRPDYSGVHYLGTYVVIGNRADQFLFYPYSYPILDTLLMPYAISALLDSSDLAIQIRATDTSFKKSGKHSFTVKVTNNGLVTVKDVIAKVGTAYSQYATGVFTVPTVTPQRGTVFYNTPFGGATHVLWHISSLSPNESLTAFVQYDKIAIPAVIPEFVHELRVGSNQIIDTHLSNDTTSQRFVLDTTPMPYCVSKGTAPWEQWVSSVSLASRFYLRQYPATAKEGYGNFAALPPANIVRGDPAFLTINPASSWNDDPRNSHMFWRAWIDWNDDGDFEGENELLYSNKVVIYLGVFFDNGGGFFVPTSAALGQHRLRVAMKVGSYPTPCETFERGEVEDYTINVVEATMAEQPFAAPIDKKRGYNKWENFTVFPNPASEEVYIDLKKYEGQSVTIVVSDVAGHIIDNTIVEKASAAPVRLDLTQFGNGTYFVLIQSENKTKGVKRLQVLR